MEPDGEVVQPAISWIPETPSKQSSVPICMSAEQNGATSLGSANFHLSSSLSESKDKDSHHQSSGFSAVAADKVGINAFPKSDTEKFSHLKFAELLALADAAASHLIYGHGVPGNNGSQGYSFASYPHCLPETHTRETQVTSPTSGNNTIALAPTTPEKTGKGTEDLGKGGSIIIDLNETPKQKTRRRKHRPKVVVEGKLKTRREPVTPKPGENPVEVKETPIRMRRYVRRKEIIKSPTTPPVVDSMVFEPTRKSCNRSLHFDLQLPKDDGSLCSLPKKQSKRKHSPAFEADESSDTNLVGSQYNGLAAYQNIWASFPNIQRKKRSEKVNIREDCKTSMTLKNGENYFWSELHTLGCNLAFNPTEKSKKKRSKAVACIGDCGSLTMILDSTGNPAHTTLLDGNGDVYRVQGSWRRPNSTNEHSSQEQLGAIDKFQCSTTEHNFVVDLVSEACGTLTRKKRSKTRSSDASRTAWNQVFAMDYLTTQFESFNINTNSAQRKKTKQKKTALVSHIMQNEEQKALVLYGKDGTIVPYRGKPKPQRPKVVLEEETNRVWKLLLENIDNPGIDGTDEEKVRWWEQERSVFKGRADSFIARMHEVQGDRRFTGWKGSVLDSVIGVFLTQNVSDHLSSSAFMAIAARFPLKLSCRSKSYDEPKTDMVVEEPMEYMLEPDDSSRDNSCVTDLQNQTNHGDMFIGTAEDIISSQNSAISCQSTGDSPHNAEKMASCSDSNSDAEDLSSNAKHVFRDASFVQLLEMVSANMLQEANGHQFLSWKSGNDVCNLSSVEEGSITHNMEKSVVQSSDEGTVAQSQSALSSEAKDELYYQEENNDTEQDAHKSAGHCLVKSLESKASATRNITMKESGETIASNEKSRNRRNSKGKKEIFDWEALRKKAEANGRRERPENRMDSVDWDAVRCADVNEIADTIKERGMNNMLAERIKDFLNRLHEEYGSLDLEWLRDVPPDQAKEYLLSVRGLGLKSVECVRLLTLHHLAFPVDTNVGRIAVRLGWVPIQPLPESLQLHLLELYPVLESIQKYLWPRLCKLNQKTLYELHYQLITFGKVFCTKSKPNCNACPMRGECKHFASAFASARLALPGPEQTSIVNTAEHLPTDQIPSLYGGLPLLLPLPQPNSPVNKSQGAGELQAKSSFCQPIIEEPMSPEPECQQLLQRDMEEPMSPEPERQHLLERDIEDAFCEPEIPTIHLNMETFALTVQNFMQLKMELQEDQVSKALVALTPEASIPMPKLKNINRLRTEHYVYELPKERHPLLEGLDELEPDDPGRYLVAIWTPGETADSIQPPESKCSSAEPGELCDNTECFSCNNIRETQSQVVRGTLLIPCRTAMRGSFPLNGTYFQVNEVFADHASSLNPIDIPRSYLWNLRRRTVFFGTSMPTIFKGLSTREIQACFWRGYVCVRGFERATRAPRPLIARLHFPASKLKNKDSKLKNKAADDE